MMKIQYQLIAKLFCLDFYLIERIDLPECLPAGDSFDKMSTELFWTLNNRTVSAIFMRVKCAYVIDDV